MTQRRSGRPWRCPACGADAILIEGDRPASRFAVFACGSSETRIGGRYRFLQTPDCRAIAEERSELDDPMADQR